jgi:hypothetical protein
VLNQERGTPVASVEISAMGANVFTTGNDGVFVLYLPDVAETLSNLGVLSLAENRQAEAPHQFAEALDICYQLAARTPARYQPGVQLVEKNLRSLPK